MLLLDSDALIPPVEYRAGLQSKAYGESSNGTTLEAGCGFDCKMSSANNSVSLSIRTTRRLSIDAL